MVKLTESIITFFAAHLWLLIVLLQLFFFIQIGIIWKLNHQIEEKKQQQAEIFLQDRKIVTPGSIRGL